MSRTRTLATLALAFPLALASAGCQKPTKAKPDYDRPLPPGMTALRLLLSPGDWPELRTAYSTRDEELDTALDRSIGWFNAPSSKQHFPLGDVTHIRAKASVYAFRTLLAESPTPLDFEQKMWDQFNCYTTVGFDDRGGVLYTGYYTPVFSASRIKTGPYTYPLYKRPADLVSDPTTGKVLGRKLPGGAGTEPYPSRSQLESSGELDGLELVYLPSRLDQYIIQVNGSAKLELVDGGVMYVGFTGTNGHEYTGLGATLKKEGKLENPSLPALREYFASRPDELETYINRNDRYVFFGEYPGDNWPAGSIGVKVTPHRSIATDKSVFPRAGVVLAATSFSGRGPSSQFMLDQDTGGAIRAASRADLYYGIGPQAEAAAGGQYAEGRLFYFFLKHENVLPWLDRMKAEAPPAPAPARGAKATAVAE